MKVVVVQAFATILVPFLCSNVMELNCPRSICNGNGNCSRIIVKVGAPIISCQCDDDYKGTFCQEEKPFDENISVKEVSTTEKPVEFIHHLENQTFTKVPSTVTFKCELSMDNVDVQWQVGDQLINSSSSKYEISRNKTVHKLIIRQVGTADSGTYVVKELAGGKNSTAELFIEDSITTTDSSTTVITPTTTTPITRAYAYIKKKLVNGSGYIVYIIIIIVFVVAAVIFVRNWRRDQGGT